MSPEPSRHGDRSRDVLDLQLARAVVDLQRGHVADLRGAAAVVDVQGQGGRDVESEVETPGPSEPLVGHGRLDVDLVAPPLGDQLISSRPDSREEQAVPCTATVEAPARPWILRSPARAITRIRRAPLVWTVASRGEPVAALRPAGAGGAGRSQEGDHKERCLHVLPPFLDPETPEAVHWLEPATGSTQARPPKFGFMTVTGAVLTSAEERDPRHQWTRAGRG